MKYKAKISHFGGRGDSPMKKSASFTAKDDFDALLFATTLQLFGFMQKPTAEDKADCQEMLEEYCHEEGIDPKDIASLKAFSWYNSEETVIDTLTDETGRVVYDTEPEYDTVEDYDEKVAVKNPALKEKLYAKSIFELSDKDLAKLSDKYLEKLAKRLDKF